MRDLPALLDRLEQADGPADPVPSADGWELVLAENAAYLVDDQHRVVELLAGDHRDQRLRQVVVDVGVHAEQHVPEGGQADRRAERDVPRARGLVSGQSGRQGIQVQVGKHDVPPLAPARFIIIIAPRATKLRAEKTPAVTFASDIRIGKAKQGKVTI